MATAGDSPAIATPSPPPRARKPRISPLPRPGTAHAVGARMHDNECAWRERSGEKWLEHFKRIAEDDEARRELIWIRARETGDRRTVVSLERVDPDIPRRLEPLAHATWERAGGPDVRHSRVRRELYQMMYDARLCHHLARVSGLFPSALECSCDRLAG